MAPREVCPGFCEIWGKVFSTQSRRTGVKDTVVTVSPVPLFSLQVMDLFLVKDKP